MSEVNSELLENYIQAQKKIEELEGKEEQFEMIKEGVGSFELDKDTEDTTKIKGVALQEGTWNGYFYPKEELEKSAGDLTGSPLVVDHGKEVKDIVGEVTDSSWDEEDEVLHFQGEIVNEEVAELVKRHLVQGVSIGANFDPVRTDKGKTATNLDFYELALTTEPAAPDGIKEVLHRKDVDYGGDDLMTEKDEEEEAEIKEAIQELSETLGTEKTGIFVGSTGENDYPSYYGYYPGYYPSYYPSYYPEYYPKKGEGGYPSPKLTDIVKKLVKVVEDEFNKDLEEVELEEAENDYPEAYGGYPAPKLTEIVQKLVKVVEDEMNVDLEEIELSKELSEEESESEAESKKTEETEEESKDTSESSENIEEKVDSLDEKVDDLTDSIEKITEEAEESEESKEESEEEAEESAEDKEPAEESNEESSEESEEVEEESSEESEEAQEESSEESETEESKEESEESEESVESEEESKTEEKESEEKESEEESKEVTEEDLEDMSASDLIFERHKKRHGS